MSDTNEYIEDYFRGVLSEAEKKRFEERCVREEAFAKEVALYISTEEGLRQHLLNEKKQQWRTPTRKTNTTAAPVRRIAVRKWIAYATAACTVAAMVLIAPILRSPTPPQLADEYIKKNLSSLSNKMSDAPDLQEQGIAAYNNKAYDTALQLFEKAYQSNADIKSKKYIGFVYLITQQYDKALQQFEAFANTPDPYDKSGWFWVAVTLLERNKAGDKARAKELLKHVEGQGIEESKEAARWLKAWK